MLNQCMIIHLCIENRFQYPKASNLDNRIIIVLGAEGTMCDTESITRRIDNIILKRTHLVKTLNACTISTAVNAQITVLIYPNYTRIGHAVIACHKYILFVVCP